MSSEQNRSLILKSLDFGERLNSTSTDSFTSQDEGIIKSQQSVTKAGNHSVFYKRGIFLAFV